MYIKNHSLETADDKGSILVPPSDALHTILAPYSSAYGGEKSGGGTSSGSVVSGAIKTTEVALETCPADKYGMEYDPQYEEEYDEGAEGDAVAASTVFQMPSLKSLGLSDGEIKMKIASGGLKQVPEGPIGNSTGAAVTASSGVWTDAAAGTGTGEGLGLGVGGWGVDKGTAWKPVSLSSTRAAANAATAASVISSRAVKAQQFPTLGEAAAALHTAAAKKQTKSTVGGSGGATVSASAKYTQLPSDLLMRKEDVFKCVQRKMSPYFGVVSPTGKAFFSLPCYVHCLFF
jgi:hypothetical protein